MIENLIIQRQQRCGAKVWIKKTLIIQSRNDKAKRVLNSHKTNPVFDLDNGYY